MSELPPLAAWIGIDWSDQHHDIALRVPGEDRIEADRIKATPEALAEWIAGLRHRFGEGKMGIVLEQSRGPLIHALLEHDCFVLYPVNPATVKRFRGAFSTSGAKADPTDAVLMLELLEKHRDRLHAWKPDDPETRALARLTEARRNAVDQRTQLSQRLTAELKGYFPQALDWAGEELTSPMALDFLAESVHRQTGSGADVASLLYPASLPQRGEDQRAVAADPSGRASGPRLGHHRALGDDGANAG
jgi:transposase